MKEDGKLDPMTAKLLRGVIQRPEDEKKREQKPGYKKKHRKGKGGDDESFSDSINEYGDEEDGEGTFDRLRRRNDVVVAIDGSEMATLNPSAATDGEIIDAEGNRRDKHGNLLIPPGISDKEWKRMQIEEELKRM